MITDINCDLLRGSWQVDRFTSWWVNFSNYANAYCSV